MKQLQYKYVIILTISLLFTGCGPVDFFTVDSPDDNYDKIAAYDASRSIPPYDIKRFRPVLKRCKLQYPEGMAVPYGKFEGFKAPYFYARDDQVWFTVEKSVRMHKIRSELRENGAWFTSDKDGHFWHARLRCLKPKKGVDSYTWMQIHGTNDTYDFPILRLMWVRNYAGKYDHIWAIIIISDPFMEPKQYEWVDLGKRPGDFFEADVNIIDNTMDIEINGKLLKHRDVGYWQEVGNYFKAGVYVNRPEDHGKAAVAFQKLEIE